MTCVNAVAVTLAPVMLLAGYTALEFSPQPTTKPDTSTSTSTPSPSPSPSASPTLDAEASYRAAITQIVVRPELLQLQGDYQADMNVSVTFTRPYPGLRT